MKAQQKHGRELLEDQLEKLHKVDREITLAEAVGARARDGDPAAIAGKLDAICRDMIEEETQQRRQLEVDLRRLGDPIRAAILWLYYTQGLSVEEIAGTLAPADDTDQDLKDTIERLLAEGVEAFDRKYRKSSTSCGTGPR